MSGDETNKYEDTATPETVNHYLRPEVMKIITEIADDGIATKAGNGDFWKWYNKDKELFDLSNQSDYAYLISHHRSLYWTLNYFEPGAFKRPKINENDTLGTRAETVSYTLGADIDHCEGTDIHTPDIKKAVEDMAAFYVKAIQKTQPESVHAAYSGGGIYVHIHHRIWDKYFIAAEDHDLAVYVLTNSFNRWIADKAEEFFILHPEHAGKVKVDALNNAKRVFKTILSVHKRLPYAVIPLDTTDIKIDFEAAKLPLKSNIIERAAAWYQTHDTETHFQNELQPYYDEILAKYNRESLKEIPISKIAFTDTEKFPPCIKNILNIQSMPAGKTRATAILAAFLGQAGWKEDEARALYLKVVNTLHADTANIFESWYKKMSCPNCKTMKEKGGSFPHVSMGDIHLCVPDSLCKNIKHPIEYITLKNGNGNSKKRDFCDSDSENYEKEKAFVPVVNNIDDIPIPNEDKIPPISFDGLWEYSYHKQFVDYVASISDGYPEYSFQNATATFSTLSRRRLYIRLNGRTEYTNLITLCLGQSGYARKGSAYSAAHRFLRAGIGDTFLSPDLTPEGMISEMADTITTAKKTKTGMEEVTEPNQKGQIRKAVCALWKDEAGQLYAQMTKPHMQSFKEQMCYFYDSPDEYDKGLSSKHYHIDAISLGMNFATTPESFSRSVVNGDISTGFLARHNIVNPAYEKNRKPLKEDTDDDIIMEAAFVEMLKIIDKLIPDKTIRIRIDKDTLDMYDHWCKDREEYFARERNEGMGSFFARFQINVLKTAALLDLGNIPASLYFYNDGIDNSYTEEKIIIRHSEIISKTPFPLIHANHIISLINNSNIIDYNISSMSISKMSLVYVMNLYDTMFIPYSYQICVLSKVDLFTNYLTNIYKILSIKNKIERSDLMRLSNVSKRTDFDEAIEMLKEAKVVLEYKVKGVTKPTTVYVYVPSPYVKLKFPPIETAGYAENGFFELTKKEGIPTKQEDKSNTVIVDDTETTANNPVPDFSKSEIFSQEELQPFLKEYSRMVNPENLTEMRFRTMTAINQLKTKFKKTQEQAERIWHDYAQARGWPTVDQQSSTENVAVGVGASQRDRIKLIREIIKDIQNEHKGGAPIEDIFTKAKEKNITREQVTDILQKLKSVGEIIEASNDRYRVF